MPGFARVVVVSISSCRAFIGRASDEEVDVRAGARLGMVHLRPAFAEEPRDGRLRVVRVAEGERAGGADADAGRLPPLLHAVEAEGALVDVPLRVDEAGVVRAG